MNTSNHKSTYALLMESQSRKASAFEDVIYGLLILSAVVSIWQFGAQKVVVPGHNVAAMARTAFVQRGS